MKNRIPEFFQLNRYHISPEDVVRGFLHCDAGLVHPDVVIMPHWKAEIFASVSAEMKEVVEGRLYQVKYEGQWATLIRSGIGAPLTGDVILALGCTPCRRVVFMGSAGGLGSRIQIGDLIIVEKSFCGDGFSRYLDQDVIPGDCFLQPARPGRVLTGQLRKSTEQACHAGSVPFCTGAVFSTDSILAQFFRLDYLAEELGCIGIEMETAAVFRAARLVGIQAAALLQVSDAPQQNKSVLAGRTGEEMEYRKMVRQNILAKAVIDCLLLP